MNTGHSSTLRQKSNGEIASIYCDGVKISAQ
jgi:hypothetical protein